MSEWRHVINDTVRHVSCSDCCCTTPTPDPASPCGELVATGGNTYMAEWQDCQNPAWQPHEKPAHTYLPTRCTCGHAIEAVR